MVQRVVRGVLEPIFEADSSKLVSIHQGGEFPGVPAHPAEGHLNAYLTPAVVERCRAQVRHLPRRNTLWRRYPDQCPYGTLGLTCLYALRRAVLRELAARRQARPVKLVRDIRTLRSFRDGGPV
jgi:hypothetical protein